MLRGAIKVIRRCLKWNVPGYLENPLTSRLWKHPGIIRLLQDTRVHTSVTDMCQYGTQWRKPTKLLLWNCDEVRLERCKGRRLCNKTGRPHLQLTGVVNHRFITQHAQAYPRKFAERLLQAIIEASRPARPEPFCPWDWEQ